MKKQYLSLIFCGLISNFSAQEHQEIEEIVIQGKILNTPYQKIVENIAIISKEEITNSPAQSIDEVLQQITGIDIRKKGANGVLSDISIRGGSFDQTLILINGIRMNDSQTGHNSMNIPIDLENVERIEVIKGPAARRFGNNAYSGVINIITKIQKEKSAKFSAEFGDFSTYYLGTNINLGGKKFEQSISTTTSGSEGYKHNTDYKINNIFYQNQFKIKDGNIGFQAGFSEKKFGANGFYASPTATEQYEEIQASVVSLAYQQKLGKLGLKSNTYWRRGQDMYLYIRNRPEVYRNMHIGNNIGGEISASYQSDLGISGLGIELQKEFLASNNLGHQDRFLTQIFFEHHFSLVQNKLQITPGISWANYSTAGNFFYPGLDIGFDFNHQHKIFANIAKVHRIPTFTDLYYKSRTELGNEYLKPENAIYSEIGYQFKTLGFTSKASVFMKNSNNAIDWVKTNINDKWQAQNIGKLDLKGFELELNHHPLAWLNYSIGYTFIDSQQKFANNLFSKYALENLKHQLIGKLELKAFGLTNELIYRYNERLNNSSYHLLDGKLSYKKADYSVYLLVNNITNTQYSETGTLIPVPMPERWFHIGMNYRLGL